MQALLTLKAPAAAAAAAAAGRHLTSHHSASSAATAGTAVHRAVFLRHVATITSRPPACSTESEAASGISSAAINIDVTEAFGADVTDDDCMQFPAENSAAVTAPNGCVLPAFKMTHNVSLLLNVEAPSASLTRNGDSGNFSLNPQMW